jgi:hypothetical protein
MSEAMHPMASHHLPGFITPPGETDVLFAVAIIFFLILAIAVGSLYFRLHSLPERIAHDASHIQFQLVAVLSLIALVTHNNVFWIAALLLALVPIPDFWTPLANMAESLAVLAGRRLRPISPNAPEEPAAVEPTNDAAPPADTTAPQLPPVEVSGDVPTRAGADSSPTVPSRDIERREP